MRINYFINKISIFPSVNITAFFIKKDIKPQAEFFKISPSVKFYKSKNVFSKIIQKISFSNN